MTDSTRIMNVRQHLRRLHDSIGSTWAKDADDLIDDLCRERDRLRKERDQAQRADSTWHHNEPDPKVGVVKLVKEPLYTVHGYRWDNWSGSDFPPRPVRYFATESHHLATGWTTDPDMAARMTKREADNLVNAKTSSTFRPQASECGYRYVKKEDRQ